MANLSRTDLRSAVRYVVKSGAAQEARERVGPRTEVSRHLKVDGITLYRWETARREPQGVNLINYARFLERCGIDLRAAAAHVSESA